MHALITKLEDEIGKLAMALLNQGVINSHKEQLSVIQMVLALIKAEVSKPAPPQPPQPTTTGVKFTSPVEVPIKPAPQNE